MVNSRWTWWFGYTRVFANPEETVKRKRVILREEINPVEAEALRDAAQRILRGETVGSIIREWPQRGGRREETPWQTRSGRPRLTGLGEWQGRKYPRDMAGDLPRRHARAAGEAVLRPVAPRPRGRPQAAPAVRRRGLRQVRKHTYFAGTARTPIGA
jgi:hypothetical protein